MKKILSLILIMVLCLSISFAETNEAWTMIENGIELIHANANEEIEYTEGNVSVRILDVSYDNKNYNFKIEIANTSPIDYNVWPGYTNAGNNDTTVNGYGIENWMSWDIINVAAESCKKVTFSIPIADVYTYSECATKDINTFKFTITVMNDSYTRLWSHKYTIHVNWN